MIKIVSIVYFMLDSYKSVSFVSLYGLSKKLSCLARLNLREVLFKIFLMLKKYCRLYCLLDLNTNCKPYIFYINANTREYAQIHSNCFQLKAFLYCTENINTSYKIIILPYKSLNKYALAQLFQFTLSQYLTFSIFEYYNPRQPNYVSDLSFFIFITFPLIVKWIALN
jgi:hypothetical protein